MKPFHQIPFLDLSLQFQSIQEELENAALRVLRSGQYIMGQEVNAFEKNFAAFVGSQYAVGVASGTDAIFLALKALGIGPGDDVLTVGNVSAPTVCAILAAQARPVLIDIDPETFNMDPNCLSEYLKNSESRRTARAIIPIHLYGRAADMISIKSIAREYQLAILEDASQAHGATVNGIKVGTMGDIGCFSLYPTKNLGACGDAGVIVAENQLTVAKLKMLRNYGEKDRYDNYLVGVNSRLDEIQAALLNVKLKYLDHWTQRRREIASQYNQAFLNLGLNVPGESQENLEGHVYHLYVMNVENRNQFREDLLQLGIGTAIHYPKPIHHQDSFRNVCLQANELEATQWACRTILSLPLYPEMSESDVDSVCKSIDQLVRGRRWTLPNTA